MSQDFVIRCATLEDEQAIGELTMRSLYSYGYDETFHELMEHFRKTNLPAAEYIRKSPVYVGEIDGKIKGYYGLKIPEDKDFIDLEYIFLDVDCFGKGYGTKLWLHAVDEARKLGFNKMQIHSDPGAVGFYEAMGAEREKDVEVYPNFKLTVFWFDLI